MTAPLLPATGRPGLNRADALRLLAPFAVDLSGPVLLGRRGYFRDSMGLPGQNDLGLYDDAVFLLSPSSFEGFNANTDPSRQRPGTATLDPGQWHYRLGIHGLSRPAADRYEALVQAVSVTVTRYQLGAPARRDAGWFGINIHRGGHSTTSSEGCQTIAPGQWPYFLALVRSELAAYGRQSLPYVLTVRGPTDPV